MAISHTACADTGVTANSREPWVFIAQRALIQLATSSISA